MISQVHDNSVNTFGFIEGGGREEGGGDCPGGIGSNISYLYKMNEQYLDADVTKTL